MPPTYYIPESRFNDDLRRQLAETHERNVAMNDPVGFAARKNAMRDAEMERQRILHGDFQQQSALKRELEGTYNRRAEEARALQGTWDQRAAQERAVHGTFEGREAGLDRRQQAQLGSEMERARLADTGAMERARLADTGATERTRMSEEGASWRRMYEPTHYGQEITLDDQGNTIHRTVPYQYGQRINHEGEGSPILPRIAPKGFDDVNHLLKTYENVPQNQRTQFLAETGAQYPDLYKQARNEMAKRSKAGAGLNPIMATAPAAASVSEPVQPTLPEQPATPSAFSGARVKRDIETPYYPPTVSGGDINPLTFRATTAPRYSPPDTTSYITQGGPEPNLQPGAPMPPGNPGIRRAMPTAATYESPVRHPMPALPEPYMPPVAAPPMPPEAPQAYLPQRSRGAVANLRAQMNEPSLFERYARRRPRSSLIIG